MKARYSVYVNCLLTGLLESIKIDFKEFNLILPCNASIMQVGPTAELFGVYGWYHITIFLFNMALTRVMHYSINTLHNTITVEVII